MPFIILDKNDVVATGHLNLTNELYADIYVIIFNRASHTIFFKNMPLNHKFT